jgi:hypothetical protein
MKARHGGFTIQAVGSRYSMALHDVDPVQTIGTGEASVVCNFTSAQRSPTVKKNNGSPFRRLFYACLWIFFRLLFRHAFRILANSVYVF